jgi:hypothetical protein
LDLLGRVQRDEVDHNDFSFITEDRYKGFRISLASLGWEDDLVVAQLLLVEKITANFDQKLAIWESKRVRFKKVIENLAVPAVEICWGNISSRYFSDAHVP